MCHFITLVAPEGTDPKLLRKVLRGHGRIFELVENWHVRKVLEPGEIYFCTAQACDCGTPLGTVNPHMAEDLERQKARKIRKGMAVQDAEAWYRRELRNQSSHDEQGDPGGWCALIDDLMSQAGLSYVGILLHWYSGDLEQERINTTRTDLPDGVDLGKTLWRMAEDELLIIRRP